MSRGDSGTVLLLNMQCLFWSNCNKVEDFSPLHVKRGFGEVNRVVLSDSISLLELDRVTKSTKSVIRQCLNLCVCLSICIMAELEDAGTHPYKS